MNLRDSTLQESLHLGTYGQPFVCIVGDRSEGGSPTDLIWAGMLSVIRMKVWLITLGFKTSLMASTTVSYTHLYVFHYSVSCERCFTLS